MNFFGIYKKVLVPFKIAGSCFRTKLQFILNFPGTFSRFFLLSLSSLTVATWALAPCRARGRRPTCSLGGPRPHRGRPPAPLLLSISFLPLFPERSPPSVPLCALRSAAATAVDSPHVELPGTNRRRHQLPRGLLSLPTKGIEPGGPEPTESSSTPSAPGRARRARFGRLGPPPPPPSAPSNEGEPLLHSSLLTHPFSLSRVLAVAIFRSPAGTRPDISKHRNIRSVEKRYWQSPDI